MKPDLSTLPPAPQEEVLRLTSTIKQEDEEVDVESVPPQVNLVYAISIVIFCTRFCLFIFSDPNYWYYPSRKSKLCKQIMMIEFTHSANRSHQYLGR